MHGNELAERVRAVLRSLAVLQADPSTLAEGDDLYDAGLRSLGAVRLLVALEREFDVELPDSALHGGAFATIGRICETIGALQGAAGQRAASAGAA